MNHPIDWIITLLIIGLGILGYSRGFLEELGRLIGFVISTISALKFHTNLALWFYELTSFDLTTLSILSFILIFLLFLFTIRLLTKMIQLLMLTRGIRRTNRLLGVIFGVLKGFVLTLVILWMIDIFPHAKTFESLKTKSFFYRQLDGTRHWIAMSFGFDNSLTMSKKLVNDKFMINNENED